MLPAFTKHDDNHDINDDNSFMIIVIGRSADSLSQIGSSAFVSTESAPKADMVRDLLAALESTDQAPSSAFISTESAPRTFIISKLSQLTPNILHTVLLSRLC